MKKIAWFAPILIAGPLTFAAACDGGTPVDADGAGGSDGTGGNDPTGGTSNDGTGGGSDGAGGSTGGTSTGGLGGLGGLGGGDACGMPSSEEIGMGGFGGDGSELHEICAVRCEHAVACGAAGCDEDLCVTGCAETYAYYYEACIEEYTAVKACEAESLNGDDFACLDGTVFATTAGVAKCADEQEAFTACYDGL